MPQTTTYREIHAAAWAAVEDQMEPSGIKRFAGYRYNTKLVFSIEFARLAKEAGIPMGPAQPDGDNTNYIRQPICWLFPDRTVPVGMNSDVLVTPPKA